jgi:26S proteasome non-ATPase regulatory subunit 9
MLNDHKEVSRRIEELFPSVLGTNTQHLSGEINNPQHPPKETNTPFAQVSSVSPGTLAQRAGIIAGDMIIKFGNVKSDNFTSMQDLATQLATTRATRSKLKLSIKRINTQVDLLIDPSEEQSLGCLIVPIHK